MTSASLRNLTILIPFRDGFATLGRLLDSLPDDVPILIVDDQSETPLVVDSDDPERKQVRVIRRDTRGYFAGAVNTGIEAAGETDVLVLNQDVWLRDGFVWQNWLNELRAEFALIGDGVMTHPAFPKGYVQGTFLFMRRDAIARVGLLNERDYPLWGCTAEWQLRACRKGFRAYPIKVLGLEHERGDAPYGSSIKQTLRDEPERQGLFVRTPPAISVIITTYNYGRFLEDAVHSLIGGPTSLGEMAPQTFQSFEIVIVDDASTDETHEIGEALADDWKGIRYLRRDANGGSSAAANEGIAKSYGKWVTVLDGDDMMEPTRLETLYRVAEQQPHHVIYDDIRSFGDGARGEEQTMPEYDFEKILRRNGMHKGILFERSAWKEVGGYPESFRDGREDWAINVALGARGYCGMRVAQPLYLRRLHERNRHLTNSTHEWRGYFVERMQTLYPNLYAGERPSMCCGNKTKPNTQNAVHGNGSRSVAARSAAPTLGGARGRLGMATLPGQGGMVLLEYLPHSSGTHQYIGPVTGAPYVFGGTRKLGYVDARDVEGLLQKMDGHQRLFRRAVAEEKQTGAAKTEVVVINRADKIQQDEVTAAGEVMVQWRDEQRQARELEQAASAVVGEMPQHDPVEGLPSVEPEQATSKPPAATKTTVKSKSGGARKSTTPRTSRKSAKTANPK